MKLRTHVCHLQLVSICYAGEFMFFFSLFFLFSVCLFVGWFTGQMNFILHYLVKYECQKTSGNLKYVL